MQWWDDSNACPTQASKRVSALLCSALWCDVTQLLIIVSDPGEELLCSLLITDFSLYQQRALKDLGIHSRCERMMDGKGLVGGEDTYKDALAHLRSRWQLDFVPPHKNSLLATFDATEENPVPLFPSQESYVTIPYHHLTFFFILKSFNLFSLRFWVWCFMSGSGFLMHN